MSFDGLPPDTWSIDYDDLEVGEVIGKGQFGEVYIADYLGTSVALKKLLKFDDIDVSKYIERELSMSSSIRHPHIAQFLGLCRREDDDSVYVVTEMLANGDLAKKLEDNSVQLSWSQRIKFALEAVTALAYIHSRGFVHRDLKAENLLLDEHLKVKLCDFGFARQVDKKIEKFTKMKRQLTIVGTDEWMAPEVILGMEYAFPADIFSFGILLTELILRKRPSARTPMDCFEFNAEQFLKEVPEDCPKEFSDLVIALTAYEPDKRPAAKIVMRGLRELLKRQIEKEGGDLDVAAALLVSPRASGVTSEAKKGEAAGDKANSNASPTRSTPSKLARPPTKGTKGADGLEKPDNFFRTLRGLPMDEEETVDGEGNAAGEESVAAGGGGEGSQTNADDTVEAVEGGAHAIRRMWVTMSSLSPVLHSAMEITFPGAKKKVKRYLVLDATDTLYIFKGKNREKNREKNLARIIIDQSVTADVEKRGKRSVLVVTTPVDGNEFVFHSNKQELLEEWRDTLRETAACSDLDLMELMRSEQDYGYTELTTASDARVFPARGKRVEGGAFDKKVLMVVSGWGLRVLQPKTEEVLLDFSFQHLVQWSIKKGKTGTELHITFSAVRAKRRSSKSKHHQVAFQSEKAMDIFSALEQEAAKSDEAELAEAEKKKTEEKEGAQSGTQ